MEKATSINSRSLRNSFWRTDRYIEILLSLERQKFNPRSTDHCGDRWQLIVAWLATTRDLLESCDSISCEIQGSQLLILPLHLQWCLRCMGNSFGHSQIFAAQLFVFCIKGRGQFRQSGFYFTDCLQSCLGSVRTVEVNNAVARLCQLKNKPYPLRVSYVSLISLVVASHLVVINRTKYHFVY